MAVAPTAKYLAYDDRWAERRMQLNQSHLGCPFVPTWHCRLKDEWLDVREAQLICDSMSFIPERFHLRGKYTRERGSILLTNNVETEINVGEAKLSKTAEDMLASGYKLEELPEELQELSEPIHERTLQRFTNPRDFVRYSLWIRGATTGFAEMTPQDFSRITIGDKTIDDLTRKLEERQSQTGIQESGCQPPKGRRHPFCYSRP